METKRRLKKIGGSVALFIPPEMPEELNPEPGAEMDTEVGALGCGAGSRRIILSSSLIGPQKVRGGIEEPLAEMAW